MKKQGKVSKNSNFLNIKIIIENKHRFNAKLKMFDHDPKVEAQKKDALN